MVISATKRTKMRVFIALKRPMRQCCMERKWTETVAAARKVMRVLTRTR